MQHRPTIIDVAIGGSHPNRDAIQTRCERLGVECHVGSQDLARLMAVADLGFGAGGTATWERCSLGLPSLVIVAADNQRKLVEDGRVLSLFHAPDIAPTDSRAIARHLDALVESPGLRTALSTSALSHVDGRGVDRVISSITKATVTVRPAKIGDSSMLFEWRNHPDIRRASHHAGEITPEHHAAWFTEALSDPNRHLLIGEVCGRPTGVTRFDIAGRRAEVSIYVDPGKTAKGIGSIMLKEAERWLLQHCPDVEVIEADVLEPNLISHTMFERSGYSRVLRRYQKGIRS
jgi:RimJ/RimL family protein N-acetyltransferase